MSEAIRYIPFSRDSSESLPSVICLGNFDGVHLGHRALVDSALEIASDLSPTGQKVRSGVLCFDTLSSNHFGGRVTPQLTSLSKKLDLFKAMGLDCAYVCDFQKIKDLSPIEFIEEILIKRGSCIGVVCGFNFRFGKNAAGDADLLARYFNSKFGNENACRIVPPVKFCDSIISSSAIRELIANGRIETASAMLGRPFSIEHTVVHGKHLGTRLGFPTLNHVLTDQEIIPAFGIYATRTVIDRESYPSVTNIGVRPTVSNSGTVTCETHIIGLGDEGRSFYGHRAEILFYSKLRDEKRFSSPEELSAAIANDVKAAENYFTHHDTK